MIFIVERYLFYYPAKMIYKSNTMERRKSTRRLVKGGLYFVLVGSIAVGTGTIKPSEQPDEVFVIDIGPAKNAYASIKDKGSQAAGKLPLESLRENSQAAEKDKTLASAKEVKLAADVLKNAVVQRHCLTEDPHKLTFPDPEGGPEVAVCLRSDTLQAADAGGATHVIFEYETIDPLKPLDLTDATPEKCGGLIRPLQAYGRSLLEATNKLPGDTTANVQIRANHAAPSPCDTWPLSGPATQPGAVNP